MKKTSKNKPLPRRTLADFATTKPMPMSFPPGTILVANDESAEEFEYLYDITTLHHLHYKAKSLTNGDMCYLEPSEVRAKERS